MRQGLRPSPKYLSEPPKLPLQGLCLSLGASPVTEMRPNLGEGLQVSPDGWGIVGGLSQTWHIWDSPGGWGPQAGEPGCQPVTAHAGCVKDNRVAHARVLSP